MTEQPGDVPASGDSLLGNLRADRDRAKKSLHLDLRVPRIEPPLFVRYGPIPRPVMNKANEQIAASKDPDAEVREKAVVLSHVCLGVYREGTDGKPAGDPEQWPRFDQRLAGMLGLGPDCGAVEVIRELYLTDGDIVLAVAELAEWSAQSERRQQEEHEGN